MLDANRVETVTVDLYGTLVDPYATIEALAEYVPDEHVDGIANQWRARSIMYTMVGNAIDFYQPFYELVLWTHHRSRPPSHPPGFIVSPGDSAL